MDEIKCRVCGSPCDDYGCEGVMSGKHQAAVHALYRDLHRAAKDYLYARPKTHAPGGMWVARKNLDAALAALEAAGVKAEEQDR